MNPIDPINPRHPKHTVGANSHSPLQTESTPERLAAQDEREPWILSAWTAYGWKRVSQSADFQDMFLTAKIIQETTRTKVSVSHIEDGAGLVRFEYRINMLRAKKLLEGIANPESEVLCRLEAAITRTILDAHMYALALGCQLEGGNKNGLTHLWFAQDDEADKPTHDTWTIR